MALSPLGRHANLIVSHNCAAAADVFGRGMFVSRLEPTDNSYHHSSLLKTSITQCGTDRWSTQLLTTSQPLTDHGSAHYCPHWSAQLLTTSQPITDHGSAHYCPHWSAHYCPRWSAQLLTTSQPITDCRSAQLLTTGQTITDHCSAHY